MTAQAPRRGELVAEPKYGEPWTLAVPTRSPSRTAEARATISDCVSLTFASSTGATHANRMARAVACVNALAGVDDPQAYVSALTAQLARMRNGLKDGRSKHRSNNHIARKGRCEAMGGHKVTSGQTLIKQLEAAELHRLLAPVLLQAEWSPVHESAEKAIGRVLRSAAQVSALTAQLARMREALLVALSASNRERSGFNMHADALAAISDVRVILRAALKVKP